MAKRLGTTAQRRADQLTFTSQFIESDAADAEEQNRILKLMRDAVAAAVATGGEAIGPQRQYRLAVILKQLYFCGGGKREGSRMRLRPKAEPDGKSLTEKLGPLAVKPRQLTKDLALLVEWGFVEPQRHARFISRRVMLDWMRALVNDAQQAAWEAKQAAKECAPAPGAYAPRAEISARAPQDLCVRTSSNVRVENKSALNRLNNSDRPTAHSAPVRWSDVVDLLGAAGADRAAGSLSPFKSDFLKQRRDGPLPDWLVDELLAMDVCTTTEGER